jgi:dTDP-4-dehydrorhamnose reductase
MKILLTGAGGQLAGDLKRTLRNHQVIPVTHAELDVADPGAVEEALTRHRPDLVINTAAYHRVDECESAAEKSFAVNAIAVKRLADACKWHSSALMQFSTDYVFDGRKKTPYAETDSPGPLSVYGTSKLAGEYLVANAVKEHYIIRTCGLYGAAGTSGKGGNFVETMMRLAREGRRIRVVSDQVLTPTSTCDLAEVVAALVETGRWGLYHATSEGECSWFEFAQALFGMAGLKPDLSATTSLEFGAPARRPPYSVLENRRLKELGLDTMRHWRDALADYMKKKGYLQRAE